MDRDIFAFMQTNTRTAERVCNKISKKVSPLAFKGKKQGRKVTKNLPFEEAFATHHIFFPQKVVVLRKTSILMRKKGHSLKSFHNFILMKPVVLCESQ